MGSNHIKLTGSVTLGVTKSDGQDHNISIRQVLTTDGGGSFDSTGILNLYVDHFGLGNNEFSDLSNEVDDDHDLPDNENPDYLGRILFDGEGNWIYGGGLLNIIEQEQIGEYISTYEEGDIIY